MYIPKASRTSVAPFCPCPEKGPKCIAFSFLSIVWKICGYQRELLSWASKRLENVGIDPATSHMLSERSTTWANSPPPAFCFSSHFSEDHLHPRHSFFWGRPEGQEKSRPLRWSKGTSSQRYSEASGRLVPIPLVRKGESRLGKSLAAKVQVSDFPGRKRSRPSWEDSRRTPG